MTIRKAGPLDLESIVFLEHSCFPWEAWPEEVFARELTTRSALYLLAEDDRGSAGYISCWLRERESYAHITSLAVLPAAQRKGIGAALLKELILRCHGMDIRSFRAETRISSQHVVSLFKKFGFKESGILNGYYTRPREDAVLLVRQDGENEEACQASFAYKKIDVL